jgi:hypothetical protein
MRGVIFGARIPALRRQIPGSVDNLDAWLAQPFLQPVGETKAWSVIGRPVSAAGAGPKRILNRRFSRPFFSILPIWISPTSLVRETCAATGLAVDGCLVANADQADPAGPDGGRTFFDFTRPGLAASSSSVIHRMNKG